MCVCGAGGGGGGGGAHIHVIYVPSVKNQYKEPYLDIWLFLTAICNKLVCEKCQIIFCQCYINI